MDLKREWQVISFKAKFRRAEVYRDKHNQILPDWSLTLSTRQAAFLPQQVEKEGDSGVGDGNKDTLY